MRPLHLAACLAVLILCGPAAVAKQSKCDVALKRIHTLLDRYGKEHPLKVYPSTLKEFQNFAAKKAMPLDLGCFSDFTWKRSGTSLTILYTCKETGLGGAIGGDTITVY